MTLLLRSKSVRSCARDTLTMPITAGQAKMVHQYGDGATTRVNVQTV
jgi:hypothetical protein